MDYTEEEMEVINEALDVCWRDFKPPLTIEKEEDILKALNIYHDHYNMKTDRHNVAIKIFEKHGLWKDGKTTIEDHVQQELQKKLEQTIRYKDTQKKYLARLKDLQGAINEKIKALEEDPKKIAQKYHSKRDEIRERANKTLNDMRERSNEQLREFSVKLRDDYQRSQELVLNGLKEELNDLKVQERNEINFIMKEYEELENLKSKYLEIEQESQYEIDRLEPVIESQDASLFDLTVRELKEMASNKGIEYPSRIVKKDLVELIESENEVDGISD